MIVPETILQLSQADLNALPLHVNPLEFSDCHGTDLYVRAREFVEVYFCKSKLSVSTLTRVRTYYSL